MKPFTHGDGTYIFGVRSKCAIFIFRYPWRAMIFLLVTNNLLCFLVSREIIWLIKPIPVCLPTASFFVALLWYFKSTFCYKVIIDKKRNKIKFYYMFNRGAIEKEIQNIKIVINKECNIIIDNMTFAVLPEIIHDIVAFLPQDTAIQYVGFFGRYNEKAWKNRNMEFKPGTNI